MDKQFSKLNTYIDLLLDAICVVDKDGRFVYTSSGCERIFGYTQQEMIGKRMIDLVHPDDQQRTLDAASDIMAGEHKFNFENRYIRKNGEIVHIAWSARRSESDELRVAVARDISQNKRIAARQSAIYAISEAAHAAENLPALFAQIHHIIAGLMHVGDFAIALYDTNSHTIQFPYLIESCKNVSGDSEFDTAALCANIIEKGTAILLTPHNRTAQQNTMSKKNTGSWLGVPLKSADEIIGVLIIQSNLENTYYSEADRELLEFVSTQIAAAIERKQMIARLQFMALYDQLTQLPNRELLHDRLQKALSSARRNNKQVALLYLDLDKFKQVNDCHGHHNGDLLLQQTAQRILYCVRESDTVARLGGDEFVILLENIESSGSATSVAEKIRQSLNQPFDLDGQRIDVMPSIGIALFPQHGDDEKQLLRHADEAMYSGKKQGGNRVIRYSDKTEK